MWTPLRRVRTASFPRIRRVRRVESLQSGRILNRGTQDAGPASAPPRAHPGERAHPRCFLRGRGEWPAAHAAAAPWTPAARATPPRRTTCAARPIRPNLPAPQRIPRLTRGHHRPGPRVVRTAPVPRRSLCDSWCHEANDRPLRTRPRARPCGHTTANPSFPSAPSSSASPPRELDAGPEPGPVPCATVYSARSAPTIQLTSRRVMPAHPACTAPARSNRGGHR